MTSLYLNQVLAQKDTIKNNKGINNLVIGVAQPKDIFKNYHQKKCEVSAWNSPDRKRIRYKNIFFFFDRRDSSFVLESIYIKLNKKKWFFENQAISKRSKVRDIIPLLVDNMHFSHALGTDGSPEYLYTKLHSGTLEFKLKPANGDNRYSGSSIAEEYLLDLYSNSNLQTISIKSSNYQAIDYKEIFIEEQKNQLFYTQVGNKTYYKTKDSLVIVESHSGCLSCSHPPYYLVYEYDNKSRVKLRYDFSGFPRINLKKDPKETILVLKKVALRKKVFFYSKNNQSTIFAYERDKAINFFKLIDVVKSSE